RPLIVRFRSSDCLLLSPLFPPLGKKRSLVQRTRCNPNFLPSVAALYSDEPLRTRFVLQQAGKDVPARIQEECLCLMHVGFSSRKKSSGRAREIVLILD